MAKQDSFMKDEAKGEGVVKEDFMDFNDPGKGSKGSGRNVKVMATVLVILGLGAGVGMYLMNQEDSTMSEDIRPAPIPKKPHNVEAVNKPETSELASAPAPAPAPAISKADMPKVDTSHPAATTQTHVVKTETMPTAHNTAVAEAVVLPKSTKSEPRIEKKEEVTSTAHSVPNLHFPENGAVRDYDETSAMPLFTWSGGGKSWIAFSRNAQMSTIDLKGWTHSNRYEFPRPAPGVWYWQVGNDLGKSEVRMFTVNPPAKRSVAILEPAGGVVMNEGTISWKGDHMVTYYRIEFTNKGWANPNYRFATTGTQLRLHSVQQGAYEMRVGAFSEVSGRWEYTNPVKVTVQ